VDAIGPIVYFVSLARAPPRLVWAVRERGAGLGLQGARFPTSGKTKPRLCACAEGGASSTFPMTAGAQTETGVTSVQDYRLEKDLTDRRFLVLGESPC
jgi:hypothetical protein